MYPVDLELDHFRLPGTQRLDGQVSAPKKPPRHRCGHEFLKGPIPLPWLRQAAAFRGKAPLAVALALWFRAGLKKSHQDIVLSGKLLERFGVSRKADYHGLAALESARLVSVTRHLGRCPLVTILDVKVDR